MSKQYDHYQEAEDLISTLQNLNLNEHASYLQSALEEGSTGNEIFMALRWNIERLLSDEKCPDVVLLKAKDLWGELDKALQ
jgi:hypothetical protein